jgi:orotidine-5'-phosphate decarboxylase
MLTQTTAAEKIITALDVPVERAYELADELSGKATWVKVGMTLFYAEGPRIVDYFKERGFKVFLDLKLHDIPHQVRGAAKNAALTGADLLTIHALGGAEMVKAAREGVEEAGTGTKLLAITILTSMDQEALASVGITDPVAVEVSRLAQLAYSNGTHGIVCSPQEAAAMRDLLGPDALIVTPGVRPAGSAVGDQSRVATPAAALGAGASHLVIGRPITGAEDPVESFEEIVRQIVEGEE